MMRSTLSFCILAAPVASLTLHGGAIAPSIEACYTANQKTRMAIKEWIKPEDISKSIFEYGLSNNPMRFAHTVTLDVGPLPIQHDFISQLGARMQANGQQVKYLEIGVSVLKGVHTQAHYFKNAHVTALDIEDPNPTIESLWTNKQVLDSWTDTSMEIKADMRRASNRTTDYVNRYDGPEGTGNTLFYVAGDAFNNFTYSHVAKNLGRQNLILSDGLHTRQAVEAEINNLLSSRIISSSKNDDFAMVWDDCHNGVWDAFYKTIVPTLRHEFKGRDICHGLFVIPGWIGKNELPHKTCVFTTLDLKGEHLGASETWKPDGNAVTCD